MQKLIQNPQRVHHFLIGLVLTAVLRPLLGLFHAAETGDLPLTRIEQEWSDTYNRYREEG